MIAQTDSALINKQNLSYLEPMPSKPSAEIAKSHISLFRQIILIFYFDHDIFVFAEIELFIY